MCGHGSGGIHFRLIIFTHLPHMNEFKIEKKAAIPAPSHSCGRYPFASMEKGDSFFVPDPGVAVSARSSAYIYAKNHPPRKFTARKEGTGLRIWRTA